MKQKALWCIETFILNHPDVETIEHTNESYKYKHSQHGF